jgi:HAD superfamily hydrolase (TIGR01509 family)
MKNTDLVIFDCDGVLVDSEIVAARVEADLLTKAGFPISADEVASQYSGLRFAEILRKVEEISSIPLQASLIEESERKVDRKLASSLRAIEGAAEAAAAITIARCVCSNSARDRISAMLTKTGLMPLFKDAIHSSDDTPLKRCKPEPDVFLLAAEKHNADPARTIVVEDSLHGVNGARAAGMRVIGFTGASHSYPGHAEILSEAGAETVINRMANLPETLAALDTWSEYA